MLINEVNDIINNSSLAVNFKKANINELETILRSTIESKKYPEEYMHEDYMLGMILHCELLLAIELKKKYDQMSENN